MKRQTVQSLVAREVSRASGSIALNGNCWYKLFSRTWVLIKGRKVLFWSFTSHVRTEAAGPLKHWARLYPPELNSTLASGNKKNSSWYLMLIFYIVPDTVLRPLHLLLCHLILKTLIWRRCYYYPHFTDGETKAKSRFKTNKTGHTGGKSQSQDLHQTSGVRIWRLIAVLFCFSVPFYLGQITNSKFYRMNNQASKCYLYYSHAYLLSHLVWYLGMCLVGGTKCSLSTTVLALGWSPASSAFELPLWTCLAPRCHKTKT